METEPLAILNKERLGTELSKEFISLASHGMQKGIIASGIVNPLGEKLPSIPNGAEMVVYHPRHQLIMAAYKTPDGKAMYWQYFECQSAEVVPLNFSAS